ncbi:MAG: sensor histidine kinase [Sandaracinaceae bacterium]
MNRIGTRLTLAASLGIALVMGVNAWLRVERERELIEQDVLRDHRILGQAVAESVASVLELGTAEDALFVLEEINQRRERIEIRWVDEAPGELGSEILEDHGRRRVVTVVPVLTRAGVAGHVELVEDLAQRERFLRGTIWRVIVATLLTIFACALFTHLASRWFVSAPLARIVDKIRSVGEGELLSPLDVPHDDELGTVARELNQMSARLGEARAEAARETAEKIAAVEQLRHADRLSTVGTLSAGIAHELGTPLNVIAARAKMIERGESEGAEIPEDAKVIREQAERVTHIIRQLLDFSRPRPARRSEVDLRELLDSVLALLRPHAKARGVVLSLAAGEPFALALDEGQLTQVMTNLVMNAIQAQPDGGEVVVSLERRGEHVEVRVVDRGPGVPAELRDRIFEPFFTTKEVGAGTGLGLSVVLGLVRDHGGDITVEAREPTGACFVVTLPLGTERETDERDAQP